MTLPVSDGLPNILSRFPLLGCVVFLVLIVLNTLVALQRKLKESRKRGPELHETVSPIYESLDKLRVPRIVESRLRICGMPHFSYECKEA